MPLKWSFVQLKEVWTALEVSSIWENWGTAGTCRWSLATPRILAGQPASSLHVKPGELWQHVTDAMLQQHIILEHSQHAADLWPAGSPLAEQQAVQETGQ